MKCVKCKINKIKDIMTLLICLLFYYVSYTNGLFAGLIVYVYFSFVAYSLTNFLEKLNVTLLDFLVFKFVNFILRSTVGVKPKNLQETIKITNNLLSFLNKKDFEKWLQLINSYYKTKVENDKY